MAAGEAVAVFTQPDRPAGRGRKELSVSPIKQLALERNIAVYQPEKFDKHAVEQLRSLSPELTVVAAYGLILPQSALDVASLDTINVHASLLPRHRGPSPIAAAILAGDAEAGVTAMKVRRAVDSGEIIVCGGVPAQRKTFIAEHENAGELSRRLAALGGDALAEAINTFAAGNVGYLPQDEARATYCKMLSKADGRIDWARPADEIVRHVRAMTPWPGAWSEIAGIADEPVRIVVVSARVSSESAGAPGGIKLEPGPRIFVGAGGGSVEIRRLKPAGRCEMPAADFVRGTPKLAGREWQEEIFFVASA